MDWQKIQELLNDLESEYVNLPIINDYIQNEQNYEVEKQNIFSVIFYLVKAIKIKLKEIPKGMDDIRTIIMEYGNDTNKIIEVLSKIKNDFDSLNKGIKVLKTIIEISDKTYEYEKGFEESLRFKSTKHLLIKCLDIYQKEDMSMEEKYEYTDTFDKTLSLEEQGELHVQSLIGKQDEILINKFTTQLMLNEMKGGNPYKKIEDYYKCFLGIGAFAEERLGTLPLEQHLESIGTILESPFVKQMNNQKKY